MMDFYIFSKLWLYLYYKFKKLLTVIGRLITMQVISRYISTILNNYFIVLFIASGAFLFIFEAPFIDSEKFATEKKIAKVGGIGYIIFGVGLYILSLFIK